MNKTKYCTCEETKDDFGDCVPNEKGKECIACGKKIMKVYGGSCFINGKQVRAIIACKYKKDAIDILNLSYAYFKDFWCETGNDEELKIALSKPYMIFYRGISDYTPYKALKETDRL